MLNPVSTYRLQFHKNFTLNDLERILPYLEKLGINAVYASPVFEAVSGSMHGYDIVNPNEINPEIGTLEKLKDLHKILKDKQIHWIQDIVPNHMAYHPDNPWIMDVLEKGYLSMFNKFFDLPFSSELYQGRVMVPFLGSSLEDAVKHGELKIAYKNGRLVFSYFDNAWPLNIRSYEIILSSGTEHPPESVKQLYGQIHHIHEIIDPQAFSIAMDEFRMQLASLAKDPLVGAYLNSCLQNINSSKEQLLNIEGLQAYRLCHWQETDAHINFRRFFTINGLICLNISNNNVFMMSHALIKSLVDEDIFQGLRVDHIDGLFDPAGYLKQLRELTGDETYITVEKILAAKEDLPQNWPVQGTTGYDFLALVNNLFTEKSSKKAFSRFYKKLTENHSTVKQQIKDRKAFILYQHMAGELENLTRLFKELKLADVRSLQNITDDDLKQAIGEFLIYCPVYRYYGNSLPLNSEETNAIQRVFRKIRKNTKNTPPAIGLLEDVFLHKPLLQNAAYNSSALRFYQLCMQVTGPLMAKGVEDTLMYSYNRFIAHNEVGDSPASFGISINRFHQKMLERQQKWPLSLNATSTHDTKRGEDVRARLNVLTDLADEWLSHVAEWKKLNQALKRNDFPDDNDEYFIYQTLIGAHPMPGQAEDNFKDRIQNYLEKSVREAKAHSSWSFPNEEYETAAAGFATALLDQSAPFWSSFKTFHQKIADYGILNSLSQVLLKFTCPGVPDVYQGCELWDLSLVDPDNRRPVNYDLHQSALDGFDNAHPGQLLNDLWQNRFDGRIKLWLTQRLFNLRKQDAGVFEKGAYIPLSVKGRYKDEVMAFARRFQQTWYIVSIPLHAAKLCEQTQKDISQLNWKDTRIILPPEAPAEWQHLLAETTGLSGNGIHAADIFSTIPIAILKLEQPKSNRGAGVLMHITSLPSPFGIGDFGPQAREFADFLSRSCQKYWQVLPLGPTEQASSHSPYSSYSSMAGNTLLISPRLLAEIGLLDIKDLEKYGLPQKDQTDYREAERIKNNLFEKAWQNFKKCPDHKLRAQFDAFSKQEGYWLEDFALYVAIKHAQENKPWYEWSEKFKKRNEEALRQFSSKHTDVINKIKWLQFIFMVQWHELKSYCNLLGIQLLGDLPFYVGYDSVDVWADPEIFSLDKNLQMETVAGVPPDYFNENGQLWGMPVFRWEKLKERGYDWWVRRIKKNMELFDRLRLDHFRAFSAYWEVSSAENTAINGKWKPGPGADIFRVLKQELGELPFVAEDLGDIDDDVNKLRNEFGLPGMKVLQFAFGDDIASSVHIPHNFKPDCLVYTGTHDNNTTTGWFKHETGRSLRKRIEFYTGVKVSKENIHRVLARLAYSSVANTAILPLQDICGLDEKTRMNTPASVQKNWLWRIQPGQLTVLHEKLLRKWTRLYRWD